uniref:Uncharacterized protein n=1 Tax=Rhizophora mucronata TaxID=61149 RepID=A0A2P2IXS9_RHIMU
MKCHMQNTFFSSILARQLMLENFPSISNVLGLLQGLVVWNFKQANITSF